MDTLGIEWDASGELEERLINLYGYILSFVYLSSKVKKKGGRLVKYPPSYYYLAVAAGLKAPRHASSSFLSTLADIFT